MITLHVTPVGVGDTKRLCVPLQGAITEGHQTNGALTKNKDIKSKVINNNNVLR